MISEFKIKSMVYLFRLMKDTGLLQNKLFKNIPSKLIHRFTNIVIDTDNIVMIFLFLNIIVNMIRKIQKNKAIKELTENRNYLPPNKIKNDYPIIVIFGFMGYVPDQTMLQEEYFAFANSNNYENRNIYIASMGPIADVHDRACEIYQQIVGITEIKKRAGIHENDNGPNLVRAVYGN